MLRIDGRAIREEGKGKEGKEGRNPSLPLRVLTSLSITCMYLEKE
jgi:hypothetical protein